MDDPDRAPDGVDCRTDDLTQAHDWRIVGRCVHGYRGYTTFNAARCARCSVGGHADLHIRAEMTGFGESLAERMARIERQIGACPVWVDLIPEAQHALRV